MKENSVAITVMIAMRMKTMKTTVGGRAIPSVNSSRRFGIFSSDFIPFFEVQYLLRVIWTSKNGVKSPKRSPNIVEEAQREWLW
jgi:hypothetical protein